MLKYFGSHVFILQELLIKLNILGIKIPIFFGTMFLKHVPQLQIKRTFGSQACVHHQQMGGGFLL